MWICIQVAVITVVLVLGDAVDPGKIDYDEVTVAYDPNCELTMSLRGVTIRDGTDVRVYLGDDLDISCEAYCTGEGLVPGLKWRRNTRKITEYIRRVYQKTASFSRNQILHITSVRRRHALQYSCEGYLKGLGRRKKSFNLIIGCPKGQEECDDHLCIEQSQICDGIEQCKDGTDEMECNVCTAEEIACDGRCVSTDARCNYVQDCLDGADELDCVYSNCTAGEFECDDGDCIPVVYQCDHFHDCDDKSDEANCSSIYCTEGTDFACNDGSCVMEEVVCDGIPDCPSGEDETNCAGQTLGSESPADMCGASEFMCEDGQCIAIEERCDDYPHCDDQSDEIGCSDGDYCLGEFKCDSGGCVRHQFVCDYREDCSDGSDEWNCPHHSTQPPWTRSESVITTRPVIAGAPGPQYIASNGAQPSAAVDNTTERPVPSTSDQAQTTTESNLSTTQHGTSTQKEAATTTEAQTTTVANNPTTIPSTSDDEQTTTGDNNPTTIPSTSDDEQITTGDNNPTTIPSTSDDEQTTTGDNNPTAISTTSLTSDDEQTTTIANTDTKNAVEDVTSEVGQNDQINIGQEDDAPRKCVADEFRCSNGVCIPMAKVCDDTADCEKGEDENEDNCISPVSVMR